MISQLNKYSIDSESAMFQFGVNFAKNLPSNASHARVIELIGDVGTGKTTFTRGFAKGLGITTPVTSPSFTISKTYPFQNGNLIHYDFYRLEDPGLMLESFSESLQDSKNIIVIEWANTIANVLPNNHIRIHIEYTPSGRQITIS